MNNILLSPPLAFFIFLFVSLVFSFVAQAFSIKGKASEGKTKPYACGEDVAVSKAQPDYKQFFPFAFFFTIMHVVVLIIATVPAHFYFLPVLYLLTAVIALFILFRR